MRPVGSEALDKRGGRESGLLGHLGLEYVSVGFGAGPPKSSIMNGGSFTP